MMGDDFPTLQVFVLVLKPRSIDLNDTEGGPGEILRPTRLDIS